MPVQSCQKDGRDGYRWGESGHCYTFPANDDKARREAKRRAYIQGAAAEAHGASSLRDTVLHKDFSGVHEEIALKADDLEAIQKFFNSKEAAEEEVFAGRMIVANTRVDRSHEQFDKAYLQRFAETLPGKALLSGHNYREKPLGRIYAAQVVKDSDDPNHWNLEARYFVDAKNEEAVRAIKLGIWKDVSIGFTHGGRVCSIDGIEPQEMGWLTLSADEKAAKRKQGEKEPAVCRHRPGQTYDGELCVLKYVNPKRAEGREVSIVWSGCQHGASLKEEEDLLACKMELLGAVSEEEEVKLLDRPAIDILLEQEQRMKDETTKGGGEELLTLKKQLAEFEPLAADGRHYREHLKAEIKRKYAACGMEQTGIAIAQSLATAPAEVLKAADAEVQALFDQKFPPPAQGKMVGAGAVLSPDQQGAGVSTPPRFDPLGRSRATTRRI